LSCEREDGLSKSLGAYSASFRVFASGKMTRRVVFKTTNEDLV
jgi:hypothetical protein